MSLDLSTPDALRGVVTEIARKVELNATQVADLTAAVQGALAGGGVQSAGGGGLDAFRDSAGKLRLMSQTTDKAVTVEGLPALLRMECVGLLSKDAEPLLPDAERRAVANFRTHLGKLASLARYGYRGGLAPLSRELGAAQSAVDSAPSSIRDALQGALSQTIAVIKGRAEGTLASSTAAASGPFLDWVSEEYLAGYIDLTSTEQQAGLARAVLAVEGSASLHRTEALKVRLLTGIGGFRRIGVQSSDTVGEYPLTNVAVDTASLTGPRGVHSALLDAVDLIDPRVTFDALAVHQRAAMLAEMATEDLLFLHGHAVSSAASHAYAAAGLAAIGRGGTLDVDGRETSESGTDADMLITCDGLLGQAVKQSNNLDDGALGMASASEWLNDVAGLLKFNNIAQARIREQYQGLPSTAYILGIGAARKLAQLNLLTAGGQALLTPAPGGNRWLVGNLYDGTPVYRHAFVGTGVYTSAGIPGAGGEDAAYLAALSASMLVRGPGHGSVKVETRPGSDAVQVTRFFNSVVWNPVPVARRTTLRVYGLDL